MRVRPATADDLEELARGFKLVVDEECWVATQPPVTVEELAQRLREGLEGGGSLLALEDDEAKGASLVGHIDLRPTRIDGVWSFGMLVAPDRRGRGGGHLLLQAAIEAKPAEVHKIELEVWPHNEAAIGLYERLGFAREGLRRDHYRRKDGELHSSVIMARLFPEAY